MPLRITEGFPVTPAAGLPKPAAAEATETIERRADAREAAAREADARQADVRQASARKGGARKGGARKGGARKVAAGARASAAGKKSATKAGAAEGAARAESRERTLDVPRRRQGQDDWCWAACVDMVLHYYGASRVKQCEIVGRKLKRPECCERPRDESFSVPCSPAGVLAVWRAWGLEARPHLPRKGRLGWISEAALRRELDAGRPVEIGLSWSYGGGHTVVVRGWRESAAGVTYFYVNDPWNWAADDPREEYFERGVGQVSYAELRAAYGVGRWKWTWTGIGPKG